MQQMKNICLLPPVLVILNHIKFTYKLQYIELFIFAASLLLYIYFNEYHVRHFLHKPHLPKQLDQMPEQKLNLTPTSSKPISHTDSPLRPIIKFSNPIIDNSLEISKIYVPTNFKSSKDSNSFFSSPSKRQISPKQLKTKSNLKERLESHSKSFFSSFEHLRTEVKGTAETLLMLNDVLPLFNEISQYCRQVQSHTEEVKAKPIVPGSKKRIIVEPFEAEYQKELEKKVGSYKRNSEECLKKINKEVSTDIKGIVAQITSDVEDSEHLNGRIQALLEILRKLDQDDLKSAIYVLCEAVVNRGSDQADSIDLGANFALNYTKFILSIAKSYVQIHEMYFLAIVNKKYLFYPLIDSRHLDEISKRAELKDINPTGKLENEAQKDRLTRSMDISRAYGFLLGTLFASKDSNFNEGDIWRYMSYVLNLKIEYIDRAYMPFLLGFFKSSAGRMRQCYGKQYVKLVKFLAEEYTEVLTQKFGASPYLRAYITQLKEVFSKSL